MNWFQNFRGRSLILLISQLLLLSSCANHAFGNSQPEFWDYIFINYTNPNIETVTPITKYDIAGSSHHGILIRNRKIIDNYFDRLKLILDNKEPSSVNNLSVFLEVRFVNHKIGSSYFIVYKNMNFEFQEGYEEDKIIRGKIPQKYFDGLVENLESLVNIIDLKSQSRMLINKFDEND